MTFEKAGTHETTYNPLNKYNCCYIDLDNMSQHSAQFAKETWKCKCGYDNSIDIWGCAVCGRNRP